MSMSAGPTPPTTDRSPSMATVAVALRGPYDLAGLPESVWTLAAFEYTEQSIRAVARVLRGEAEPTGRLPVTL